MPVSNPKDQTAPQLVTADEVAALLRLARRTVIVMARDRRIPSIRVGRCVRFDLAEIRRWLDRQRSA